MGKKNQVIVITGCSTGIGRALTEECARLGHRVFATARRPESLSGLVSDRVTALALDVTSEDSIASAVGQVAEQAGRIDVLINNAGVNLAGPIAEMPLAAVKQMYDTNVVGLVAMTQAVFPHMAKQGRGRIINIGSIVSVLATPFAGNYCASKAAVHAISESLRMEVAPFGVEVVEVQPGGVRSNLSVTSSAGLDRYRAPEALYRPFADGVEARANASQQGPMDTAEFAKVIMAESLADKAPRIVRAGKGSSALPALAKLPGEARDKILSAKFGLNRKL